MVNKDYILRIFEKYGRFLAIILHLRQLNRAEEALIYIDDLFVQMLGLTSSFINSVPEELLLQMISPMGAVNVEKCIWIAGLLKAEGDIYEEQGNSNESYYRYLKSLYFFLAIPLQEFQVRELDINAEIDELLDKLDAYELPTPIRVKLFRHFELVGRYAKAEDVLFDILEGNPEHTDIVEQGIGFYARLQKKSDADLLAGNLSREEVEEGLAQLSNNSIL